MTKEIKFRAWLKEKEVMANYVSHLKHAPDCGVFEIIVPFSESGLQTFRKLHSIDEFELMQFTGLHDKNGVEIYEGDIIVVRTLHDGDEYCWNQEEQKGIPQEVKWDDDYLNFDFGGCSRIKYSPHDFEVIGNIYQNKDLLNI